MKLPFFRSKIKQAVIDSAEEEIAEQLSDESSHIQSDNPIRQIDDDVLGRSLLAESFVEHLITLDSSEGIVVGILGPWGSGKTSFINLSLVYLKRRNFNVFHYNPWMFSGAEQLLQSFFNELSAQLRIKPGLADIGETLGNYGDALAGFGWLPLLGPWIEGGRGVAKAFSGILQAKKQGIGRGRLRVEEALSNLDQPLFIVLDDIDRLSTAEIRDVFKLVRLTARFPKIIYILAFDRIRIEQALTEQAIPGRDYLEKIIQVGIDLPVVSEQAIRTQVVKSLDTVLNKISIEYPFNQEIWPDVFMEIILPLIKNMRDVRRYSAAIYGTLHSLNGDVELCDILSLEAIRIFLPDSFKRVCESVHSLVAAPSHRTESHLEEEHRAVVNKLLSESGDSEAVIKSLIRRLFPAASRHLGGASYGYSWRSNLLRERRVAHEDVLILYLERVVNESFKAFMEAEIAWSKIGNEIDFDSYLKSIELSRIQEVVSKLENFEDLFTTEHLTPAATVLLNILPSLPKREVSPFEHDTAMVFTRVIYRLLRVFDDASELELHVRGILENTPSLSSRLKLIQMVGYRDDTGHQLIPENRAKTMEREWRDQVRSTPSEELVREADLFRILLRTVKDSESTEVDLEVPDSPSFTYSLLLSARTEVQGFSAGNRAIHRSFRLSWDGLSEILPEDELRRRVTELARDTSSEMDIEVIQLAERYSTGWRPNDR